MILIGQYDSPFVRRVAIALRLYGLAFEHQPWSTFADADKIAPFNPLRRVPTLVLDGGEALIESTAILDYLDELVGPQKAMIAARGPQRRHALKICALATGLGDKAVSLVYERVLRKDALRSSGSSAAKRRSEACWRCWRRSVPALRRRSGSATVSDMPISRSLAYCDSPVRRIRNCSTLHAIRRWRRMPRVAKRCRRSWKSCSH